MKMHMLKRLGLLASLLLGCAGGARAEGDEAPLVTLAVVDAETSAPIERFVVIPGVPYDGGVEERSLAQWQPQLAREGLQGRYQWPRARSYETFRFRIEAEGHRTQTSAWFRRTDAAQSVTIRLPRDPGIRGVVLSPDGSPAAGANLGLALPCRGIWLEGGAFSRVEQPPASSVGDRWRRPFATRADAEGRFAIPTETDPAALLVIAHESGYLQRTLGGGILGPGSITLRLEAWGKIEGRVVWGDRPAAGETVELIVSRENSYPVMGMSATAVSDARGFFAFTHVPPGRVQLGRVARSADGKESTAYRFPISHIDIRAGEPTPVVIGGRGRTVVGRLIGRDSYEGVTLRVHPTAPHIGLPGDDEQWKGWSALSRSPLGSIVFREGIEVGPDGTFRLEGLMPERYQLLVVAGGKGVGGTSFTVDAGPADGKGEPSVLPDIRVLEAR